MHVHSKVFTPHPPGCWENLANIMQQQLSGKKKKKFKQLLLILCSWPYYGITPSGIITMYPLVYHHSSHALP